MKVAYLEKKNKPAGRSGAPPMPLRAPPDIQESLKILRFGFRRNVGFRPVIGNGALFYRIDGRLRTESEIVLWAESGRAWPS